MTLDGTYTGTIDRVVDEVAVVLVEGDDANDGEPIEELNPSVDTLPDDARDEGTVLRLTFDDGDLVDIEAQPDETEERLKEARDRFDRLSKRPPKKDEESLSEHDEE